MRKSTLSPFLLFLVGLLSSCGGLATKNHPPLVFALNLSSAPVTLHLMKGDEVLAGFDTLAPQESRPLVRIAEADGVILRQTGADGASSEWADPAGSPYSLRFQAGSLYALVVDPLGQAALYALPETYSSDPKLCIVNAGATTLAQVQAAPAWAKNVKVYAQDVAPVVPSEFHSFKAQTLGLYWQTLDQVEDATYVTAAGFDGKPLRTTFEEGRYYVFLAGVGAVRDLTPTLD